MAFWATIISCENSYIHCDHDHHSRLRITQATLGLTSNDNLSTEKVLVFCEHEGKNRFLLCVLIPGNVESQSLALEVEVKEDVKILVIGDHKVSLLGYFPIIEDKFHRVGKNIPYLGSKGHSGSEVADYDYEDGSIVDDRDPKGSSKRQSSRRRSCGEVEVNSKDKKASSTSVKPNVKPEAVLKVQLTPKFEL